MGAQGQLIQSVVVLSCAVLFGLEFTIGAVRTEDYFTAKYQPNLQHKGKPALRAVSEASSSKSLRALGSLSTAWRSPPPPLICSPPPPAPCACGLRRTFRYKVCSTSFGLEQAATER